MRFVEVHICMLIRDALKRRKKSPPNFQAHLHTA